MNCKRRKLTNSRGKKVSLQSFTFGDIFAGFSFISSLVVDSDVKCLKYYDKNSSRDIQTKVFVRSVSSACERKIPDDARDGDKCNGETGMTGTVADVKNIFILSALIFIARKISACKNG